MRSRLAVASVAVALILTMRTFAEPQAPVANAAPVSQKMLDAISGIWNRVDLLGGGNFDQIYFPEAELFPEYAAKVPRGAYDGFGPPPPGWVPPAYDINAQSQGPTRCAVGGGGVGAAGGGIEVNSGGMSLVASKDLVLMARDGGQGARQIYTDGRSFPERLTGLYSIGHWENDTLVVKTRGFSPGVIGQTRDRGKAYQDTTTEATETMKPSADGKTLVITYKHEDPKIFIKPFIYDIPYERLPVNQYAFESWCDSREWLAANPPAPQAPPRQPARP